MTAPTPSIHVFLGRPLFLLSPCIHSSQQYTQNALFTFPLQQWIGEHVTTSRYTQIVYLFLIAPLKLQRFLAIQRNTLANKRYSYGPIFGFIYKTI